MKKIILISELKCRNINGKLNLLKPELKTLAKEIEETKTYYKTEASILGKLKGKLTTRTFLDLIKIHSDLKIKIEDQKIYKLDLEKAKSFKLSVKEYRSLIEKAKNILSKFNTGHTMGCYRKFYLDNKYFTSSDLLLSYSRGYKHRPTYGELSVSLTKKQLRKIENIGGLPTIVGEVFEIQQDYQVKHAEWLENTYKGKKGCKIQLVKGYLVEDYHATSIEQIYDKINQLVRIEEEEELKHEEIRILRSKFISLNDSLKVNCIAGTQNFIDQHNLHRDFGYNVGYLLDLGDRQDFVLRAARHKLKLATE